ncbi:glycosyltransferase family 4 protein [Rhabdaerophilum sp.]|uniref:glycosyltransferase family 4 protein n=1 Tax=Rhabdaerophilum sp. TaxID=2717341 RepID=UPI0038D4560B
MGSHPESPIIFDFSKYIDYLFQRSPTGISRIDVEYASALSQRPDLLFAGYHREFGIPTWFQAKWLTGAVRTIHAEWDRGSSGTLPQRIQRWLCDPAADASRMQPDAAVDRATLQKAMLLARTWPWQTVWRRFPRGAIYLNTSYAGLENPRHLAWLSRRLDIRAVFMIHDLLPIDRPELFWDGIEKTFPRKIEQIIHRADLVIVPSDAVRERVRAQGQALGRLDIEVVAHPTPPAREFLGARIQMAECAGPAYVIACGTIEPRKNHLLLIQLWRQMVLDGLTPPKLLLVGSRGWKYDTAIKAMADPVLRGRIVEISGLSTTELRALVERAAALLMPSIDEGYGMPLVEALAVGTPVLASDIPVFREVAQGAATLLPLDNPPAWRDAVLALADPGNRATHRARAALFPIRGWEAYFDDLFRLLAFLPGKA